VKSCYIEHQGVLLHTIVLTLYAAPLPNQLRNRFSCVIYFAVSFLKIKVASDAVKSLIVYMPRLLGSRVVLKVAWFHLTKNHALG
jgi:hypothetical protein